MSSKVDRIIKMEQKPINVLTDVLNFCLSINHLSLVFGFVQASLAWLLKFGGICIFLFKKKKKEVKNHKEIKRWSNLSPWILSWAWGETVLVVGPFIFE